MVAETDPGENAQADGKGIEKLSFEDAMTRLDSVIEKLERGSVPLEAAIQFYETGMQLAQHCGNLLDATEAKVNQLVQGTDGSSSEVPLPLSQLAPGSSAPSMDTASSRARETAGEEAAAPAMKGTAAGRDELFGVDEGEGPDQDDTIPF